MEKGNFLEILIRIRSCIKRNEIFVAKSYINLEINNLIGITEKECKKYKSFNSWYCYNCRNKNCGANKTLL